MSEGQRTRVLMPGDESTDLLREVVQLLRSIDRKLTVQAGEWVICPACLGRGERNHPNSRGDNYWLPCHQCAKLGRVRKETTDG